MNNNCLLRDKSSINSKLKEFRDNNFKYWIDRYNKKKG